MNKDLYVDEIIQTITDCKKGLTNLFSNKYAERSWDKWFTDEEINKLSDALSLDMKKSWVVCRCIKFFCSTVRQLNLYQDGGCSHCGGGAGTLSSYRSFSIPFFEDKCSLEFSDFRDESSQKWVKEAIKGYQPKMSTFDYVCEDTSTRLSYLITVTCEGEIITNKEALFHYSSPKVPYPLGNGYNYSLEKKINCFHNKNWLNICVKKEDLDEFLSINNLVRE